MLEYLDSQIAVINSRVSVRLTNDRARTRNLRSFRRKCCG
jgi:hypothetical protein